MSIKLEVLEYCDECPEFEPRVSIRDFGRTLGTLTTVKCAHTRRCEEIAAVIEDRLRKEIEDEHN